MIAWALVVAGGLGVAASLVGIAMWFGRLAWAIWDRMGTK